MMPVRALVVATSILLLADGCTRVTEVGAEDDSAGNITARIEGNRLIVQNGSEERILFGVVERRWFETALISWCFGHDECGSPLEPGESRGLPLAEIYGYEDGDAEAIVFWWLLRPALPPEERAAAVKELIVPLR